MNLSNEKKSILVIEDEEDIQELLTYNLAGEGYQTVTALTGDEGLRQAIDTPPDLILLDLMLPGISGMEICKKLRANDATTSIPLIMLTALGSEEEIVKGLEAGADDYVTKPFSIKILLARIESRLRQAHQKTEQQPPALFTFKNMIIDHQKHRVTIDGKDIQLTFSEYAILDTLVAQQGGVMTRKQIVAAIRGGDIAITYRSIDVHVTALRKKLGALGNTIVTVRGVGYRFDE